LPNAAIVAKHVAEVVAVLLTVEDEVNEDAVIEVDVVGLATDEELVEVDVALDVVGDDDTDVDDTDDTVVLDLVLLLVAEVDDTDEEVTADVLLDVDDGVNVPLVDALELVTEVLVVEDVLLDEAVAEDVVDDEVSDDVGVDEVLMLLVVDEEPAVVDETELDDTVLAVLVVDVLDDVVDDVVADDVVVCVDDGDVTSQFRNVPFSRRSITPLIAAAKVLQFSFTLGNPKSHLSSQVSPGNSVISSAARVKADAMVSHLASSPPPMELPPCPM
jgi:hypothetical protein